MAGADEPVLRLRDPDIHLPRNPIEDAKIAVATLFQQHQLRSNPVEQRAIRAQQAGKPGDLRGHHRLQVVRLGVGDPQVEQVDRPLADELDEIGRGVEVSRDLSKLTEKIDLCLPRQEVIRVLVEAVHGDLPVHQAFDCHGTFTRLQRKVVGDAIERARETLEVARTAGHDQDVATELTPASCIGPEDLRECGQGPTMATARRRADRLNSGVVQRLRQ